MMTPDDAADARWADDGGSTPSARVERPSGASRPRSLEWLYARHTLIATGRADGDSLLVHLEILERLAANQQIAERQGWTSLALERVAGMGRLRLWGVPASAEGREVVPDWAPR